MTTSKRKISLLLLLPLGLLACRFLFPASATPTSLPPTRQVQATAAKATSIPAATEFIQPTPTEAPPPELIVVVLDSKDGSLEELLLNHAQKAVEMGMLPIVEFDAEW